MQGRVHGGGGRRGSGPHQVGEAIAAEQSTRREQSSSHNGTVSPHEAVGRPGVNSLAVRTGRRRGTREKGPTILLNVSNLLVVDVLCNIGLCIPPFPEARGGLNYHTVISRTRHLPWVPGRAGQRSEQELGERRFTPPNIEARPSASGARRRSYSRGSEVGDRCRPSLNYNHNHNMGQLHYKWLKHVERRRFGPP